MLHGALTSPLGLFPKKMGKALGTKLMVRSSESLEGRKPLMSCVMSNTSVRVCVPLLTAFFSTKTWGALPPNFCLGGGGAKDPPAPLLRRLYRYTKSSCVPVRSPPTVFHTGPAHVGCRLFTIPYFSVRSRALRYPLNPTPAPSVHMKPRWLAAPIPVSAGC